VIQLDSQTVFDMKLSFCNSQVQGSPVNTVTNGSKKFGRVNGVAVLSGQGPTLTYTIHHTSHSHFVYDCVLFNK